ncbi:CysS/YqeB C-terminal domain-containing protein, partial [Haloferula sp.]|uniref:CysS/YqeB C-terminal domain-containing protein n=1 Tax=Haloferula sp. TaxID=2497595 RepID=UPI003C77E7AC
AWEALNDDLNTPGCLGGIFTGLRECAGLEGEEAAKALAGLNRVLRAIGLILPEDAASAEVPAEIQALADERWEARSSKDWAKSDAMRDQLAELGWAVKDSPEGYELNPT